MMSKFDDFPVDYDDFMPLWEDWRLSYIRKELMPTSWDFGRKNLLADEVLGKWSINGKPVELSAVVFTIGATRRYIGVTIGGEGDHNETGLAASFDELEKILGI